MNGLDHPELLHQAHLDGSVLTEDARFDWDALARETRVKRFGRSLPDDFKEKARQMRFLEYRGFGHDQIRRALESDDD